MDPPARAEVARLARALLDGMGARDLTVDAGAVDALRGAAAEYMEDLARDAEQGVRHAGRSGPVTPRDVALAARMRTRD